MKGWEPEWSNLIKGTSTSQTWDKNVIYTLQKKICLASEWYPIWVAMDVGVRPQSGDLLLL